MSLGPSTGSAGFRAARHLVTGAAMGLAMFGFAPGAHAQMKEAQAIFAVPPIISPVPESPAPKGVPKAECLAFGGYVLDEDDRFTLSDTFFNSARSFVDAGCRAYSASGKRMQIVTETNQDGISLGTALSRMGEFDIFQASGVVHCHRPKSGLCPDNSASTPLRARSGS